MPAFNVLNSAQGMVSTSNVPMTSSMSSSISEKSTLFESSNNSFGGSITPDDYLPRELSVSFQNLVNQGEQRKDIDFDPSMNPHTNTMTIDNNEFSYFLTQNFSNPPPPPPLEFDVSPSNDQILSPEEFDAIFESFAAAADGRDDYKMAYRNNNIPMFDLLESEKLTQALESFSII